MKYKDKEPATHGLFAITVSVIPEKRTSFKVKVMGDRLHLPPPANAFQLFRQHSNVLVQLIHKSFAGPTIWLTFRRRSAIPLKPCLTSERPFA